MIKLDDATTWPRIRSLWIHRNGNQYIVEDFANTQVERQDDYPTTIIYRNATNGELYCRKLMDWERSMTEVKE